MRLIGLAVAAVCGAAEITDHHQHLYSPQAGAVSSVGKSITASDLVAHLDAAGMRRDVVLSVAYMFSNPNRPAVENEYEKVKAENDWTSQQVAQYPDRLRGFCSVNPIRPFALDEVARCAKDPNLRTGLKLHFGNSDVDVMNAEHVAQLRRLFRAANRNGMAIVVHIRSTLSKKRPYGAPHARAFIEQILPEAPGIPIQIAHLAGAGGYDDPAIDEAIGVYADAFERKDSRVKNVYFDISGVVGLGNWKERAELVVKRMRQLGLNRFLYGSDGAVPGNLPQDALTRWRLLPLTEEEFRIVESNTAPYLRK